MSAAARPIYVPGVAAFHSLQQRAQAALDGWAREWMTGWTEKNQRMALQIGAASDGTPAQAREPYDALCTDTGCMWLRCSDSDRTNFACAVVGSELMPRSTYADDWIGAVADRAWEARNRALCSALLGVPVSGVSAGSMSAGLFAFGSGAVRLSCDVLGLHVIVDCAIWRSVPPTERAVSRRLPALTPLDCAAHRATARLDIVLGSVEVDLPKLLDLHCGDVLRLPHRLDQGISMLCEGRPLARAVLGEAQGCKCVQVFPLIKDYQ